MRLKIPSVLVISLFILTYSHFNIYAASTPIQIFASDISEQAIQKARIGEYPESISRDVSPEEEPCADE